MSYKDKIGFMMFPNSQRVKQICFLVIDVLQQFKKEDTVVSLAILWLMICDRYNLKTWEVLDTAQVILHDSFQGENKDQLTALKEYMKNDLK